MFSGLQNIFFNVAMLLTFQHEGFNGGPENENHADKEKSSGRLHEGEASELSQKGGRKGG